MEDEDNVPANEEGEREEMEEEEEEEEIKKPKKSKKSAEERVGFHFVVNCFMPEY